MDRDSLLSGNQLSLTAPERSAAARQKRAHEQFARDYAEQTQFVRAALRTSAATPGTTT